MYPCSICRPPDANMGCLIIVYAVRIYRQQPGDNDIFSRITILLFHAVAGTGLDLHFIYFASSWIGQISYTPVTKLSPNTSQTHAYISTNMSVYKHVGRLCLYHDLYAPYFSFQRNLFTLVHMSALIDNDRCMHVYVI